MKLKVKFISEIAENVYENGKLLQYATQFSSGFDLRAVSILQDGNEMPLSACDFELGAHKRCLVKTGISTSFDASFEMQIRPRSGLALKSGITIVNTPGTIDSDYRGEIGVILLNTSDVSFKITQGDRIAQAVICPVIKAEFEFTENLEDTERSSGGFGSSGTR
ncbi:dUTP diphosphatase [Candidatus Deianiraea vastatrix]|uniref:dUTP diphosphatase n=1 Tax=Candidatus Deianiraea vastatrix TaxID=2163644 RepID=A0A5B8XC77_9RICK|nr:dUTP diphosphatase [Candidatus Deianiraea vastatrix]QED22870.1 Deoxyuridine 5'-triphosphate nucleotidohydrolase [Candidatus Deianiraea vastatrix]